MCTFPLQDQKLVPETNIFVISFTTIETQLTSADVKLSVYWKWFLLTEDSSNELNKGA